MLMALNRFTVFLYLFGVGSVVMRFKRISVPSVGKVMEEFSEEIFLRKKETIIWVGVW